MHLRSAFQLGAGAVVLSPTRCSLKQPCPPATPLFPRQFLAEPLFTRAGWMALLRCYRW